MRWWERRSLALAALLGAGATTAGIALTATSGWLVVRASEQPAVLTLLTAVVAVRAFGIARPVLRYAERLRSHDASLRDLTERRAQAYARLVPLTPARLGRRRRADLLGGVVDDLTEVVEAQVRVTVPVVAAAAAGVLTAVLTALLAPTAGLVAGGLVVVTALVGLLSERAEAAAQAELLAARAVLLGSAELAAARALEVRAAGLAWAVLDRVDAAQGVVEHALRRQSRGRATTAAAIPVLVAATTVAVAVIARDLEVPIAVKGLLVLTPVAVVEAFQPLVEAVRASARARAAAARLAGLLGQEPAISDSPHAGSGSSTVGRSAATTGVRLELTGARASWDGVTTAVGPVDLDLPAGVRLLVTGPNGGGKSTLLALLARQLELSGGRYTVDGIDVRDRPVDDVRSQVAVVDDEPHVFASTLRENLRVALPLGDTTTGDPDLVAALRQAGLAGWVASLPAGLDTRLGSGSRGMSGGERARLAVARALLSGRPALLLDEPFAHLDHATAEAVLADLLASAPDQSVVVVSHTTVGVERFDTVLDLEPARVPR
jgi:thiol reductant ABC exporter CydC subunit